MRIVIILISALILATGCNSTPRQAEKGTESAPKAKVRTPDFNADSAYRFVKEQLAFGPRVPNTPAHEKCAAYLSEKLKGYAEKVISQKGTIKAYNGTPLRFENIIASWKPDSNNRIFLCAHWDSRPYADHDPDPANRRKPVDAANDGASGVGVLLEIARQISILKPSIGIDIILFDVEDYGPPKDHQSAEATEDQWGLGSQYWSKNPHRPDYFAKYGILLDMVGASGATFLMEGISMQYAPDIVKLVWSAGGRSGFSNYFLYEQGTSITDDHLPINQIRNIPTIDIIHLDKNSETGFYPYWHTTKDNLAAIDKSTLKAVGQTLMTVLYEEE
jgi:Zn-dependent M28 family amino/carboxypeptidase